MTERALRWGILSTANIGLKAVIPALARASNCNVVAIGSRELSRAEDAAKALHIARAHGGYEALLADPEVEAVYNPLPNSLHLEWTRKALEAGKHVLCEKPLGVSAGECLEMERAASSRGLKLMEAFMYRFHPRVERLLALAREGAIGDLRLIRSAFSFRLRREADIRFNPALGGGALYDVGCYCVNISRSLAGEEPLWATALARWTEGGVDHALAGTLRFPSGAVAQFDCAFTLDRRESLEVVGTAGRLLLGEVFVPGRGETVIVETHEGEEDRVHRFEGADPYEKMVRHFAACVLEDRPLRYPAGEAAANLRAIKALYRSARNEGQPEAL
jgi:D-xylose 1-dehydrogenase (NADP+, D-xylono-1,5-lactone-forming)